MNTIAAMGGWQTFWQMSGAAFVMLILLAAAIQLVLVLAPLKWMQLRRLSRHQALFEQDLELARSTDELLAIAEQHRQAPGGRVLLRMVQISRRRRTCVDDLLGCARRAITAEETLCNGFMPTLASIAAVAPLFGLFGTVWGIIETFLTIAAERSSELPIIAPAMSGALLTTALGLLAAMPAALVHNHVNARIQSLLDEMDASAQSWAGRLASDPSPSYQFGMERSA